MRWLSQRHARARPGLRRYRRYDSAMATEDGAAQEPTPSGWKSLSSDTRLFIVTFAGTVLANVVTIMVVAVAVIIARPRVSGQPKTAVNILWYIGLAAVSTVIAGGAVAYSRHRDKEGRDRRTGWLAREWSAGALACYASWR